MHPRQSSVRRRRRGEVVEIENLLQFTVKARRTYSWDGSPGDGAVLPVSSAVMEREERHRRRKRPRPPCARLTSLLVERGREDAYLGRPWGRVGELLVGHGCAVDVHGVAPDESGGETAGSSGAGTPAPIAGLSPPCERSAPRPPALATLPWLPRGRPVSSSRAARFLDDHNDVTSSFAVPTAAGSSADRPGCAGTAHRSSRPCPTSSRSGVPPSARGGPAIALPSRRDRAAVR